MKATASFSSEGCASPKTLAKKSKSGKRLARLETQLEEAGRKVFDVLFPPMRKQHSGLMLFIAVGVVVALTIFDFVADMTVVIKFVGEGDWTFAMALLTPIIFSCLFQTAWGVFWDGNWYAIFLALTGLFPAYASFRAFTTPPGKDEVGRKSILEGELMQVAIFTQLVFLQLPQVLVQLYALLTDRSVDENGDSSLQIISIALSFTAVVLITLRIDVSTDADPWLRGANRSFAGYIPTDNRLMCFISIFFTFTSMMSGCAVKFLSSCCLFWASHTIFWTWFVADIILYNVLMLWVGNWLFAGPYNNEGNALVSKTMKNVVSTIVQSMNAIGISFIPSGVFRMPAFAGGRMWILWRLYILASSGVALHLAFYEIVPVRDPGVVNIRDEATQDILWYVYSSMCAVYVISLIVVYKTSRRVSRRMFYAFIPFSKFMETDLWYLSRWNNWGDDLDAHRAFILYKFAIWPSDEKVKAWLQDRYSSWSADASRPEWFSDKFMSIFPFWYLPKEHVEHLRDMWPKWEDSTSGVEAPPWFTAAWKAWIGWNPYDYTDSGQPTGSSGNATKGKLRLLRSAETHSSLGIEMSWADEYVEKKKEAGAKEEDSSTQENDDSIADGVVSGISAEWLETGSLFCDIKGPQRESRKSFQLQWL